MYGQGKSKKRHVEGDAMWIYKSKAEMIEERGIGKVGGNEYREHKDELEGRIDEIQIYGEKFYLDVESCKHYLGINGVEGDKVAKSCNRILGTNTLEENHLCINGVSQEEYDKVKAELEQYKEAINGYREKIERAEEKVEEAKEIYGNKIWRYLKKRVNISDEDYEDFMKFLDS